MQRAMQWLVPACLPVLAFGALIRAGDSASVPPVSARFGLLPLVAAGVGLSVRRGGFVVLVAAVALCDPRRRIQRPRHRAPAAMVLALAAQAAAGWAATSQTYLLPSERASVWLQVGLTTVGASALLLATAATLRALVGFWQGSDLRLWPGRRTACLVVLTAALAATPVSHGGPGSELVVFPAIEQIAGASDSPGWVYYENGVWPLLVVQP